MEKYTSLARQAAAEGIVMLKNDGGVLPLKEKAKISVFGRIQFDYYKSGMGSGGLVNTPYVVGILDALKKEELELNTSLLKIYEDWTAQNPIDPGKGWAQEPWSQAEMPITEEIAADAARLSDTAVVIIGRTAGEDRDAAAEKGSYLLTDIEEDMLKKVCAAFEKTVVLLNVGSIMDMNWVERYNPTAVLYVWQGGMEGGNGVADVLMGRVSPCGKLSGTIAKEISDYPSDSNFGNQYKNLYAEDIYVGYRYFETFARDRVLYPFGYGMSYSEFEIEPKAFEYNNGVTLTARVTNIGNYPAKEVVQAYLQAPQGALGKPVRCLVAFGKTPLLKPNESTDIELKISDYTMSSYDDSGKSGNKSCYVLEAGEYILHIGNNVRNTAVAGSFVLESTKLTERLSEAGAPKEAFDRTVPKMSAEGELCLGFEPVTLRTESVAQHIESDIPKEIPYTGDKGYKLIDVVDGKVSLDDFTAQLSDYDMCCIVKGEGMCSPKVTPGTAAAFGGLTEELSAFGIPCACCADGPSGIRMDCGTLAFSLPGGFCLACTFDKELVEELYNFEGAELRKNKIDTLLGPGINIHRHPLNGRNFEYFSEDPFLTGSIAVAQLKGMGKYGVTGTIKHFAGNNQEYSRRDVDAVVSERALREIYLKGFEMAVRDGGAYSIMTTYGPLNGVWTAGNYDICTKILRNEWGYDGMVMSDWGADISEEGAPKAINKYSAMVKAQNDIYMAIPDTVADMGDLQTDLASGKLTRAHLARCTQNILKFIMKSPVMDRFAGREDDSLDEQSLTFQKEEINLTPHMPVLEEELILPSDNINTDRGSEITYGITVPTPRNAVLKMRVKIDASDTAQVPVTAFVNNVVRDTRTLTGTKGETVDLELELGNLYFTQTYIRLFFAIGGMQISEMKIVNIDL